MCEKEWGPITHDTFPDYDYKKKYFLVPVKIGVKNLHLIGLMNIICLFFIFI